MVWPKLGRTNKMKLKSYTARPDQLTPEYRIQFEKIIDDILKQQSDPLWKNWGNFHLDDQLALTVGVEDHKVKVISSIYNRETWKPNVFRVLNRFYYTKDIREKGGTKKYDGEYHLAQIFLHQQIQFIKENYDYEFYFVSRQRGHKFLKLWAQHYNEDYGGNLTVSEDRYWVTPSKKDYYGGCQRLIYPKDLEIPFEKGV